MKVRVWVEAELDVPRKEAALQIPSGFKGYVTDELRDGHTVQVLRAFREEECGQNDAKMLNLFIKVQGMQNGETLKPAVRTWVEGNAENEADKPEVLGDRLTVSSTGRYSVAIDQNNTLTYTSYFDLRGGNATGDPGAEYSGTDIQYGTMMGYGITVMMFNDPAKGLKGLEIPADGLEFELHVRGGLYLDGEILEDEQGRPLSIAPVFWALKENDSGNYGRGLGQTSASFNMNWNDIDDAVTTTNYAYNAAPFNSGNDYKSCYSGGGWTLLSAEESDGETVLRFRVSGYDFNLTDANPTRNSDGSESIQFNNNYSKAFSAGYVQLLYPFPQEEIKGKSGFLSIDMQGVVSDLQIRTASGQEPEVSEETSALNGYFGDQAAAHASGEIRFEDNYIASTNSLYIGTGDSNLDQVSVTSYFGRNGSVSGFDGIGKAPLGTTVYVGGTANFTSAEYRTDEEYLDEGKTQINPRYIPDNEFNPQTDNLVEYNYLTAINLLQKFDGDVFTPVGAGAIVDQRIRIGNQIGGGAFVVESSETTPSWTPNSLTREMNLTILYAAKPDGSGWEKREQTGQQLVEAGEASLTEDGKVQYRGLEYEPEDVVLSDGGTADMDRHHEEDLLYFETMEDLKAYFGGSGKCVGILYEGRDCCIRTGRNVRFEAKLQITDDFAYTGHTYCTTNDTRIWTTYRPDYREVRGNASTRKGLLYEYNWADEAGAGLAHGTGDGQTPAGYSAKSVDLKRRTLQTVEINGESRQQWVTVVVNTVLKTSDRQHSSGYVKTEYEYGSKKGGTHNGWLKGNTLLLHTLESEIHIDGADRLAQNSNSVKTHYDLAKGERVVNYRVDPSLRKASAVSNTLVSDGTQSTEVTIRLSFPKGIRYREGSVSFDYTPDRDGQGRPVPSFTEDELNWSIGEIRELPDGSSELILKTFVSDISKNLPDIMFSGFIGSEGADDVEPNTTLTTRAAIYATYEEHNQLASIVHEDQFSILAEKSRNVGVYENVLTLPQEPAPGEPSYSRLIEIGEDFGYELVYYNVDTDAIAPVVLADVLPYNGDGRGTEFQGGYQLREIQLIFTGSGAAETAEAFRAEGGVYFGADTAAPAGAGNEGEILAAGSALFGDPLTAAKAGTNQYNGGAFTENGEERSFRITLADGSVKTLSTDAAGKLLYVCLPQVGGGTYVHVNLLFNGAEGTGEEKALIQSEGKGQSGGNCYGNDFTSQSRGNRRSRDAQPAGDQLRSLNDIVTVVQRSISGFVFMDMNQDGRYSLEDPNVRSVDDLLENIAVQLMRKNDQGAYVPAVNVLDEAVPIQYTGANGQYKFNDLGPGEYQVVFVDGIGDGYLWSKAGSEKLPFGQLAVTGLPGEESSYYLVASNVNRSCGEYDPVSGELKDARLKTGITLPAKGTMKTATVVETNNNAGFYCIEAMLVKEWTGMARGVPGALRYTITGSHGVSGDAVVTTEILMQEDGSYRAIMAEKDGALLDQAEKTSVSYDFGTIPSYTWEVGPIYLQAEDQDGAMDYRMQESFENGTGAQYDPGVLSVSLDAVSGRTIFKAVNHQRSFELSFVKADQKTHEGLNGAEFTLTGMGSFVSEGEGVYHLAYANADDSKTKVDTLTPGRDGRITVKGLPSGELTLTETKSPEGYLLPDGSWTVTIDENGNSAYTYLGSWLSSYYAVERVSSSETVTAANGEETEVVTENTYVPNMKQAPVAVSKTVTGNLGSRVQAFSFTLTIELMSGRSVLGSDGQEYRFDGEGKLEFELKHGERLSFSGIPAYVEGTSYTIEEKKTAGSLPYSTSYRLNGEARHDGASVTGLLPETGVELAFLNALNADIPTGNDLDLSSGTLIVILGLATLAMLSFGPRRRRKEDPV